MIYYHPNKDETHECYIKRIQCDTGIPIGDLHVYIQSITSFPWQYHLYFRYANDAKSTK